MAYCKDYKITIRLIGQKEIIAYTLDNNLTINEFKSLPKKLQKKFRPIHEVYKVKYIKQ